jgi:pyridoxine 5-phosphate synthase
MNLLINIDHVATLRNAREETFPDPVHAAAHCEQAGAGGLDVAAHRRRLDAVTDRLYDAGVDQVSYFVDPVPDQIEATAAVGANCVELHTGDFAEADTEAAQRKEAERLAKGAEVAHEAGLRVHAGHGLDYQNFSLFRDAVPHVAEVSIGFAVMAHAILVGMDRAVRDMRATVTGPQP